MPVNEKKASLVFAQSFKACNEHLKKLIPELEFTRNEINRLRFENNGLSVKHENVLRNLLSLELENKKLRAQVEVAVGAARKTELFNLQNRSSFVMQKVQVEATQKERDILEEKIVNLQFENVELKTGMQRLKDQLRTYEKERNGNETIDQLRAGALKAVGILERERDQLVTWIVKVKELMSVLSKTSSAQKLIIRDLMFSSRAPNEAKSNEPAQATLDETPVKGTTNSTEFPRFRTQFLDMQIRLTEAVNRSMAYEESLKQTTGCMLLQAAKSDELKNKISFLEAEIARLNELLKEKPQEQATTPAQEEETKKYGGLNEQLKEKNQQTSVLDQDAEEPVNLNVEATACQN